MQGGQIEDHVGYVLKQAQQALRAAMDRALRERGLTTPQYAVLSALEAQPGLSNAELARRAFVTPQTMNGIVVLLERAGLVARRPHDQHGRVLTTELTPAGRELVRSCHAAVEQIEERMVASLNAAERAQLVALLRACASALQSERRAPRSRSNST